MTDAMQPLLSASPAASGATLSWNVLSHYVLSSRARHRTFGAAALACRASWVEPRTRLRRGRACQGPAVLDASPGSGSIRPRHTRTQRWSGEPVSDLPLPHLSDRSAGTDPGAGLVHAVRAL